MTNRVEISKILQSVKSGGNDHGQKFIQCVKGNVAG